MENDTQNLSELVKNKAYHYNESAHLDESAHLEEWEQKSKNPNFVKIKNVIYSKEGRYF